MDPLDVVRRRLVAQRLAGEPCEQAGDVVRWLGAVQAQEFAEAKWSLGERMSAATDADVEASGATVTRPPAETAYGGYAGYFADLDGHVWEIAYNPGFGLDDDGAITIPSFGGA